MRPALDPDDARLLGLAALIATAAIKGGNWVYHIEALRDEAEAQRRTLQRRIAVLEAEREERRAEIRRLRGAIP